MAYKLSVSDLRWTTFSSRGSRNTPNRFMLKKPVQTPAAMSQSAPSPHTYELSTAKQLVDRFRLSCAFEEEGGLWIIYEGGYELHTLGFSRLHSSPSSPPALRPHRGGFFKRSVFAGGMLLGLPTFKMSLFWRQPMRRLTKIVGYIFAFALNVVKATYSVSMVAENCHYKYSNF